MIRSGFKTPFNNRLRRFGPYRSVSGGTAPDTEYMCPCLLRFFVETRFVLGRDLKFRNQFYIKSNE